jgi:hypothetical protein
MKNTCITLAVLLCLHTFTRADEVEDAINNALKLYKEGKAGEAASALEGATKSIRAKQGGGASAALPDKIGNWRGGEMDSTSLAQAGGGNTIKRDYRKGDSKKGDLKKATITIAADASLLGKAADLLANPALAGLLGIKSVKVGDKTAILEAKKGLLQMTVNDRHMIMVQGKKISEDELIELASGVKLDALK